MGCGGVGEVGGVGWRGALASTSRSAKASSPMTALFYSQPVAGQCLSTGLLYIPLEPGRAHINVLNTHACTSVGIRSKQKHGGEIRTIAPNIRTIHRNSTSLRRKSNYAVPIKHTTLFLFPTNHKFKNPANFSAGSREKILFAKHEPGSNNHPLSFSLIQRGSRDGFYRGWTGHDVNINYV